MACSLAAYPKGGLGFLPLLLPSLCLPDRVPGEILKYEKFVFGYPQF